MQPQHPNYSPCAPEKPPTPAQPSTSAPSEPTSPLLHDCPRRRRRDPLRLRLAANAANTATLAYWRHPHRPHLISRGDFHRIEVHDNGGPWTPAVTDTRTLRPRHRPSLATDWGIDATPPPTPLGNLDWTATIAESAPQVIPTMQPNGVVPRGFCG